MSKQSVFLIFMLSALAVNAQTTVNLHGTVSNTSGKPIASAIVTLVGQGLKDTTGADGSYSITKGTVSAVPNLVPHAQTIFLNKNFLEFSLPNPASIGITIFDLKGNLLNKESLQRAAAGFYRFDVAKNIGSTKLLVVKASIGRDEVTLRSLPLHNGKFMVNQLNKTDVQFGKNGLAKITVISDTLKITAAGFQTKTVAITSYENQSQNISLDSNSNNGKNPPGPSIGCGKELSDLKSGTYTITSASLTRSYIIDIPADYNKNNPYRLIFAMHCMGSSDTATKNQKYYEQKTYADNAKVPVIFVAPQGYTDSSPWRVNDNKDHIFFDDMLKLFKEKLCVDTTRIFCCGFSYGAMVSYSLSTDHQKQLRAVATYAPANWNIWLPTNTHAPIAYYQTTGTTDNLCKYINDDAKKEGGKYCVLQHIEDNGCTAPATIPTATSTTHVTTEFPGCKEGYPVLFGSFQGGHSNSQKDPGSSVNWIAKETWDFFMRF
jgi:poly(3-hydroxybutyrate) depolymerase